MRVNFNSNNGAQLQKKYRILLQEAERLASVDPKLSNTYFNEACKVMNKLNLYRRQNPSYL